MGPRMRGDDSREMARAAYVCTLCDRAMRAQARLRFPLSARMIHVLIHRGNSAMLASALRRLAAAAAAAVLLPIAVHAQPAGGDVSSPILVKKVEPRYTSAAMVAKITGVVVLEVVVKADGTVGAVRVAKSLDTKLGLDQAAIDAAKEWTFKPGMRRGQPVDVIVTLILEFRLH